MAWPVAYMWIVLTVLAGGGVLGAGCRTDDGQPPTQPQQEAMEQTYTTEQVKAARARTGFDEKAMRIGGVVGVGTAGSPSDSWISVLCTNAAARDSAAQALGTDLEGVPIRYRVTGVIRAQ